METRKLAVVGILIVAVAFIYFAFGKLEKVSHVESNSSSIAGITSWTEPENTTTVSDIENAEGEANFNEVSDEVSELIAFDNHGPTEELSDNLEREFSRLVSEQGIHQSAAHSFLISRDFGRLFNLARESERNLESYEMEATYQDIFMDSEQVKQNDVYVGNFACDNRVCLAKVEYQNQNDIESFMQHVFFQEGRGAVGVIARAVSVDGITQMRIIFDYTGSSLVLD